MNINLRDSELALAKHSSKSLLIELRKIVNEFFHEDYAYYSSLSIHDYRAIVTKAQDAFNQKDFARRIALELQKDILSYIDEPSFMIQSNLYLRATRFGVRRDVESISWHRETFYGLEKETINIWTPILNVNNLNTLRFIPESQKIADKDITTELIEDPITKKGSDGNKIGFLYAPKKIIGGVDLTNSLPMTVPYHSSSIFPGNLIHGGADNLDNKIRFSVDLRILPESAYDSNSSKFHLPNDQPYFEHL
tara:strand:+ start:406 stop:1155 length:750 start_codon:yes stop_codon:yes gene_type:complete